MSTELDKAYRDHAWTLAIVTWLVGAALLYWVHWLIGDIRSRDVRWWLDALLYVVSFFYVLALGSFHDFFLGRIYRKHRQTQ